MGSDFDHYVKHKFPFQKGLFAEIVNDLLLLSVFAKHLILDVWMGSEYASMQMISSKYKVFITILTFFLFLFLIVVILKYY